MSSAADRRATGEAKSEGPRATEVESRLRELLAESRTVFELAPIGLLVTCEGVVTACNPAFADMVGRSVSSLIGRPSAVGFAERDEYERFARDAAAMLASGKRYHGEIRLARKDGTELWCELEGQPVRTRGGPRETVWCARDITAERRSREALARALLDQRAILDNASVGIVFARDQRVERVNAKACEIFGYTEDELIGQPGRMFYADDESYATLGQAAGPLLGRGELFQTEIELCRRGGGRFWARLVAKAVDSAATHQGTIWIVEDVSQQRRAALDLQRTLRELEAVFENGTVGVAHSRAGLIQRCNRKLEEIFGVGPGELLMHTSEPLFKSPGEYRAFIDAALPHLGRGEYYEEEREYRRKDGQPVWCRVAGRAVNVNDPEAGLIWIIEDVTTQRAAQSMLLAARDDLERRVAERTRDLRRKNAELEAEVTERKLAEAALRDRSERLLYHRNRLMELAQLDKSDMRGAFSRIAQVATSTLKVGRTSLWLMLPEGTGICCELVHWARPRREAPPRAIDVITAEAHPAYFAAIQAKEIIVASDAATHPATRSLAADYLVPLDVASMLDVPVWLDGRVVGMLCLEKIGARRFWKPEDVDFAQGVATMIALSIEASQRKQAEEKLVQLAHYDALTGLPNRNLLQDRLRQSLAVANRGHSKVALMFLDLDRFKTINDSLGHLVGDRLLQEIAGRLTGAVRAGDTVARLGGDEFVVVLQNVRSGGDAAMVAQNLLDAVSPPVLLEGAELHVSASIGISLYPEDGTDVESLMRAADVAMYHVKDGGRNGYQFFAATMNTAATKRLTVETQLRQAIRRRELVLHYQPQVDLATRRVRAIEALVRWHHPEHGLVMPGEFIGVAEESGLILQIGSWALAEACAQNRAWQAFGAPKVPVCVNLSARQFRDQELVKHVRRVLQETGLEPQYLELEITETTLMHNSESTLAILEELNRMGIELAVDDFGMGYSSLSYLKRFPVDKLKIDQSFVRDIPGDPDDSAIAAAIISLSASLKLQSVAEGVETEAQLEFFAGRGCDAVQGNLFCPPLPADEMERIFSAPERLLGV
jgi:diguanylate cyclase (GGDEF)-like protein/PAS domain S-box-containing protein